MVFSIINSGIVHQGTWACADRLCDGDVVRQAGSGKDSQSAIPCNLPVSCGTASLRVDAMALSTRVAVLP
jgi:hypothetical protein